MNYSLPGSSVHGNSPGQNTEVGCHAFLQGIIPAQGLNPGLPHCRQILYHLSHQGSSRILEWVAYPFSSGSSQPRNQTRVSCIAGRFFTSWTTRETLHNVHKMPKLMSCCMSIIFQLKKKSRAIVWDWGEEGVNSAAQSLIESQRCDKPKAWEVSDTQDCWSWFVIMNLGRLVSMDVCLSNWLICFGTTAELLEC